MNSLLRAAACLLLLVALGCGKEDAPPPRPDTGAAAAARGFFEALARKDWTSAYRALDADSRAATSEANFARLAQEYRRGLGFEPAEVRLSSCDERKDEAIAHINLKGRAGSSQRYRKDTVSLRKRGGDWFVVLPRNFGKSKPAKQ
jgi:hypothetical protein